MAYPGGYGGEPHYGAPPGRGAPRRGGHGAPPPPPPQQQQQQYNAYGENYAYDDYNSSNPGYGQDYRDPYQNADYPRGQQPPQAQYDPYGPPPGRGGAPPPGASRGGQYPPGGRGGPGPGPGRGGGRPPLHIDNSEPGGRYQLWLFFMLCTNTVHSWSPSTYE